MSLVSYGGPPSHFNSLGPPSFVTPTFLPSSNPSWQYNPYAQMQVAHPSSLPWSSGAVSGPYGSYFQQPPHWSASHVPYVSTPKHSDRGLVIEVERDEGDEEEDDEDEDEEYERARRRARQRRKRQVPARRPSSRVRSPSPPLEIEDSPKK